MEPVIHLRGAVALLGRFPALAGVDLDVDAGEIVLVRGPNGAGKTSLLRVLAGLVPLSDGRGIVLGHDLRRDRVRHRPRVGLLSFPGGLYDDLTVRDNVSFWMRAADRTHRRTGSGSGDGDDDVAKILGVLGLDGPLAGREVGRLSSGQRRRVALAVLIARRPELWLLDEPHAGLDNDARDLLDGLVRKAAAAGATVLVASHELERAGALAAREVVLSGGVVLDGAVHGAP